MNVLEKTITVTPDSLIKIFLVTSTEDFDPLDQRQRKQTHYFPVCVPYSKRFSLYDIFNEYRDIDYLKEIFVIDDLPLEGKIYRITGTGGAIEYATTRGYA